MANSLLHLVLVIYDRDTLPINTNSWYLIANYFTSVSKKRFGYEKKLLTSLLKLILVLFRRFPLPEHLLLDFVVKSYLSSH